MFGPLYHHAAQMGIAATALDDSTPHVVAMMLHAPTTPEERAQAETVSVMEEKIRARREGRDFDVMRMQR